MSGRVHTFWYFLSTRPSNREFARTLPRDGLAARELYRGLEGLGFRLGESLLNTLPLTEEDAEGPPSPVDLSGVDEGDVILLATRPPLDDIKAGSRKRVERGNTTLEDRLFAACRPFLATCARSHMVLPERLAAQLGPEDAGLAEMEILQNRPGAPISRCNAQHGRGWQGVPTTPGETAMFLLHLDAAWPGGPGIVCAFGMDMLSTLVWCHRLGTDLAHLLEGPRFLVARTGIGEVPERVTRLSFCSTWHVRVALDVEPRTVLASSNANRGFVTNRPVGAEPPFGS